MSGEPLRVLRSPAAILLIAAACASTNGVSARPPPRNLARRASASSDDAGASAKTSSVIGRALQVPGATYRMGSETGEPDERPVHEVRVGAFEMDVTEVTVGEYGACVRARACAPASSVIQFPGVTLADHEQFDHECNADRTTRQDHPENCVDWGQADAFCRWAGKRLPTEEEWEYAACGGNCEEALGARGGVPAILAVGRWPFTVPVATSAAGPFGLHDMADNVWEWTASPYCLYDHPGCGDPRRVVRGGSWAVSDALRVRLTDRSGVDPFSRNPNLGFRCARSPR